MDNWTRICILIGLVFSTLTYIEGKAIKSFDDENYLGHFDDALDGGQGTEESFENTPAHPSSYHLSSKLFGRHRGIQATLGRGKQHKLDRDVLRCGVADEIEPASNHGTNSRVARFLASGKKWKKDEVTFRFVNYSPDVSVEDQRKAIHKAFQRWSDVIPLTFVEVTEGGEILLSFVTGDHGDIADFDGKGGTFAHAYKPKNGDIHFDDDEKFTVGSYYGVGLDFVATHEIGHSIGLKHSKEKTAIMQAVYNKYDPKMTLTEDDILGAQVMYGKPEEGPDACSVTFDAIFADADANVFLVQGSHIWGLGKYGGIAKDYPKKLSSVYFGMPNDITAAFTSAMTQKTYFFKGDHIWRFSGTELDVGYPKKTDEMGLPHSPDAAFYWRDNEEEIYILKGNKYYMWNEAEEKVLPGSRGYIRAMFEGAPLHVDDVTTFGKFTYFFKDGEYWRFSNNKVVDQGFPKSFSRSWLWCLPQ
ncbi:stromelysin-1-like [Glandiceps talaboti]